jgi:superfamily II DNA or RNA helicase
MESLAGFYFLLYEYNLTGILYYNGTLSQRVIDLSMDKIKFVNMPFNNQTINMIKEPQIMEVREYQKEAVIKLKNKKSSILSIPCGMGKTYIASLLAKDYDNIIILSPLRCLAQQTLEQFKNYMGYDYEPILVSIDGTRDMKKINSYIKNKNIFSSTYCSVDIIYKIITNLKNVFIIIDEFHNLSDNEINNKEKIMNKILYYDCNKIFLSATPIDNFMEIKEIYTYSWENAIKNKYICDFDIYIPDKNDDFSSLTNLCNENMNIKTITKTYFMLKSMLFNGDKKLICYATCIEYANEIAKVIDWMSKMLGIELEYWILDYKVSKIKREKIINSFTKTQKTAIIINIHILDEGIDIANCDSVFITQPNNNISNIVQRMCRANRITSNKNKCNMYIWCRESKINIIMNYITKNMKEITKDKIFMYNTSNKEIIKYTNINYEINNNIINTETHKKENCSDIIKTYAEKLGIDSKYVIYINNKLYFNVKQCCLLLDYKDYRNTIHNHIEKKNIFYLKNISPQYKNMYKNVQGQSKFVNERGLYSLILKSKKENAKKIQEWILQKSIEHSQ